MCSFSLAKKWFLVSVRAPTANTPKRCRRPLASGRHIHLLQSMAKTEEKPPATANGNHRLHHHQLCTESSPNLAMADKQLPHNKLVNGTSQEQRRQQQQQSSLSSSSPQAFHTKTLALDPSHFSFFPSAQAEKAQNPSCIENPPCVISSSEAEAAINHAASLISLGEVVAIPTETVYGLAANALSQSAVSKIFAAKARPLDNPLIVHVSSLAMLRAFLLPPGWDLPAPCLAAMERFWPGPLTVLVKVREGAVAAAVTCGHPTVAVRMPEHPVARALIDRCGVPLAAPSANASGRPSPTLAEHVETDLSGRIPLILDGGPCGVGVESTVLDALRSPPAILRPGGVTYEQLRCVEGFSDLQVYRKDFVDKSLEEAPSTPGMKYRHYSPNAEVVLFDPWRNSGGGGAGGFGLDEVAAMDRTLAEAMEAYVASPRNVDKSLGVLLSTREEDMPRVSRIAGGHPESVRVLSLGPSVTEVARGLFRALREMDARGVAMIFVVGVEEEGEGLAIMNRLRKAASSTITLQALPSS